MKPPILSTATVTVSADMITAGSAGSGYLEIEELVENSRIHFYILIRLAPIG